MIIEFIMSDKNAYEIDDLVDAAIGDGKRDKMLLRIIKKGGKAKLSELKGNKNRNRLVVRSLHRHRCVELEDLINDDILIIVNETGESLIAIGGFRAIRRNVSFRDMRLLLLNTAICSIISTIIGGVIGYSMPVLRESICKLLGE